ncbi:NAD(P)-dependent oxidoreductase [Micromonospora sp. DT81.3]|uniref:NAD(P)-dependent oxidoreductase n=1 Tax=Micromonospora sp. DT81.3 TaxID=3416523 RepID=UPI003CF6776D
MARIAVIGGTGYAGSHIVAEAVRRGHTAVSVARSISTDRIEGATYMEGTLLDVPGLVAELQGADVVVVAVAPRGDMQGSVRPAVAELAALLPETTRLGVIGGAGGSLVAPEGPRLIDTPGFTEEFKPEAFEMIGVLEDLQASGSAHDWFFVHPAGGFGPWNEGERTGEYRDGGDVLVTNEKGESLISGADLGVAVIDEIEDPKHSRDRFTVGY